MKKNIIIAISVIFFATNVTAQKILDTTILRCKYKFTHITDVYNSSGYSEDMILEVGKNICKFYSETDRLFDSVLNTKRSTMISNKNIMFSSLPMSNVKTIMYFNYPKGKITTFDKIIIDNYEYEEDIENINWQLFPDENRDILGYNCKKARCIFRGRDYDVWYAPDISVNGGVWKFSGLPGLILRITDLKLQVQFACEYIEKISIPIKKNIINDKEVKKVHRKEFLDLQKKFYNNSASILNENEIGTGTDANGNPLPPRKKLPYNPIELE
jgi:GLPGLI family protein